MNTNNEVDNMFAHMTDKNKEINKILATMPLTKEMKVSIFPGTNPDATPQEIAEQIHASIKEIIENQIEPSEYYDD